MIWYKAPSAIIYFYPSSSRSLKPMFMYCNSNVFKFDGMSSYPGSLPKRMWKFILHNFNILANRMCRFTCLPKYDSYASSPWTCLNAFPSFPTIGPLRVLINSNTFGLFVNGSSNNVPLHFSETRLPRLALYCAFSKSIGDV